MGIFDAFRSKDDTRRPRNSQYTQPDDYHAAEYTREELGDDVSVILADRWPTGKPFGEYELIYAVDPDLADPILLRSAGQIFIPKGTKLLPFENRAGIEVEDTTYWASCAQLINPELAAFIDYDWEYKAPDSMEGRVVARREMTDDEADLVGLLISAMESNENGSP